MNVSDCLPLILTTFVFALVVALLAGLIARQVARGAGASFWLVLIAILAALAVLQGGSRLPLVLGPLYDRLGLDAATACGGNLHVGTFVAVLVVTCAFVAGFFVTWRREQRGKK